MPVVLIDGVPHAYEEAGHGPPLLLLHAGITDRRMWDDVMPALSEHHRVVRLDFRGYGETPLPDGPFVYAADVAAVLEALGMAPTHVCGVSMGAEVALDLLVGRPELVDRVVLVAPGVPGWEWDAAMEAFEATEAAAVERGDLDAASWLNVRFWVDGPTRSPEQVDAGLRGRVHQMQRGAFELDNPAASGGWLEPAWQRELGAVLAPTLILVGDVDHPDFTAIGRHLAEHMTRARLELLPGLAHLPPMEAPDRFSRILLDFLAE